MSTFNYTDLDENDELTIITALGKYMELYENLIEERQSYLVDGIGDQTDLDAISDYESRISDIKSVTDKLLGRI